MRGLLRWVAGKGAVITAGVGSGLFATRLLAEFIPDQLAALICMSCAMFLAGTLVRNRVTDARRKDDRR